MKNHDIIEIEAELRAETIMGFLLFDGEKSQWFPKSLVENHGDGTFSMPEWLALEKEFI